MLWVCRVCCDCIISIACWLQVVCQTVSASDAVVGWSEGIVAIDVCVLYVYVVSFHVYCVHGCSEQEP